MSYVEVGMIGEFLNATSFENVTRTAKYFHKVVVGDKDNTFQ